ncbi:MAG: YHS domain-containing protein [Actinobacteria bacterium]|uniref:Unannotated protein n=1 Tax=freshwater metagenome TaxID=449393 RepID=A0A6J7NUE5_9ZZZZ|nr:YHS domain-containing protein [Actinomycetota bacterium]MSW10564.1 YHS domain-containing protein [Actinomycetota bacterium]MSX12897.1 YHS domain-containing protein [Actinomycetota bacterium]MSY16567.1 YHS domain-containing protein [Actinomycetota bacterium]MSY40818.1 YHS domain-containing protein [Actinomycetota bacterium]
MTRRAVRERADQLTASRIPFVHARVVFAEKPTSAKPGDEALILGDGTMVGFVGGQCAEATVRAQGLSALDTGECVLLRIAPIPEPDQHGKLVVHNPCLSGGTLEIFMEPVFPAPLVRVLGDSPIAQALNAIGSTLGYEVAPWVTGPLTNVDAVILASHGDDEEAAIISALKANVPYVGLVASPKRGSAVLDSLDVTPDMRARVHAPAGLNIGAQTPEEIALSIFAEIIEGRRAPKRIRELPLLGAGKGDVVYAGDSASDAALANDPICNMVVAAVESSIHADHDGSRWYFCCLGCKEKFLSDPAKFAGVA